jgi:hypothetical protein
MTFFAAYGVTNGPAEHSVDPLAHFPGLLAAVPA